MPRLSMNTPLAVTPLCPYPTAIMRCRAALPDRAAPAGAQGLRAAAAFTLVEMLAVIGVLAILVVAAGPAMLGGVRGSPLLQAGNQVTALAASARQAAVTKQSMSALVLLTAAGTEQDYRAFTLMEFQEPSGWVQTQGWQELPPGVLVDPTTTQSTFLVNGPASFPGLRTGQTQPPLKHLGRDLTPGSQYVARIFVPSGGLRNAQDPAQIRLVEGQLEGTKVRYSRPGSHAGTADFIDVAIIGVTGTTKTSRP